MEDRIYINYENIFDYAKDSIEYMFVDKAEVVPGKEAWGTKMSSHQDWYYKMHFPGNPIMPGVFVMEMIMTTGSFIVYTMENKKDIQLLFDGCKSIKMYKSVRPGDILKAHVELKKYRLGVGYFVGEAYVDDKLVCKMEFTLIAPEDFPKRG